MPDTDRRPTRAVRAAAAVLAAVVVSGCTGVDPAIYDPLRDLASEIGVDEVGAVLGEDTWGTGGFSSDLPRLTYLVGGCDAYDHLTERLAASGYERQGDDTADGLPWSSWSREGRRGTETAFVLAKEPGAEVRFGESPTKVDLVGCGTEIQISTWRRP